MSRITAKAAIEMLVERGLVQRIPGKGSFVTKTPVVHSRTQSPSKLIGVILCDIDHSFGFDILKGIEEEASRRNIHIIFKELSNLQKWKMTSFNRWFNLVSMVSLFKWYTEKHTVTKY